MAKQEAALLLLSDEFESVVPADLPLISASIATRSACIRFHVPERCGHLDVHETSFDCVSPRIIVDAHLTEPPGGEAIWDHDDIHAMYRFVRQLADELGIEQIVTPAVAMSSPAPTS